MPKEQKNASSGTGTLKDTTRIITVRFGTKKVRLPGFISWPFIILVCTAVALVILFHYSSTVQSFNLPKQGDVSQETIIAPFTFDILKSPDQLERDRKEAMAHVLEVFSLDHEKKKIVRQKLTDIRNDISMLRDERVSDSLKSTVVLKLKKQLSDKTIKVFKDRPYLLDDALFQAEQMLETGIMGMLLAPSEQKLKEMRELYNAGFTNHMIYDKEFITLLQDSTTEITIKYTDLPVKEVALEIISRTLRAERMFDQDALNSIYEILDAYLLPNVIHDGEQTQNRMRQAAMSVLSTNGKVIKDTEIIRKHQEVSDEIVERLKSLRAAIVLKQHGQETWQIRRINSAKIFLILLFLVLLGFYLVRFHHEKIQNPRHLAALATGVVLQIAIIRIGLLIVPKLFESGNDISLMVPEYIIPTAVASILAAILFDLHISILVTLFVSVYFSIVLSFNQSIFIYSLIGGFVGAYSTQKIRYRWDFFKAIPPMAITYSLIITIWSIISYKFSLMDMTQNIGLGIINCIITIFVVMISVAIFEHLFDITTNMTLIELSDMNHPLLKRLSIEAAGTYNHSVLVANLAESAAERVQANPLLTRVASYYHDVGKIGKPNYFVENQKMEKNIHDKLSPSMSALIISSHVKEGVELARKYKMPSVIQDAILQHHGTSSVSFFYAKAVEQDQHNQVREKDYCYPGPRPQTREYAIIMLADSVEAASRSLSKSSPKMLRALVKKIIHDKFASSQLDECDLTFKDLDKIIEGFMPVLEGIFHTRIEYPNK